jgi:hypothetical protein
MNAGRQDTGTRSQDLAREIDELVDECRDTCLWYQPRDYRPQTDAERWLVLDAIQKHADRRTFQRAARLKEWLSRLSSDTSAAS